MNGGGVAVGGMMIGGVIVMVVVGRIRLTA